MQQFFSLVFMAFALTTQAAVITRNSGWRAGQEIKIKVLSSLPADISCLSLVADEIKSFANINLRFITREEATWGERFHADLSIQRTHGPLMGSSHIGNISTRHEQISMSLMPYGHFEEASESACGDNLWVMRHELAHLLGMRHEHQHPRMHPALKRDLLATYARRGVEQPEQFEAIAIHNPHHFFTEYDPNSVMHYDYEIEGSSITELFHDDSYRQYLPNFFLTEEWRAVPAGIMVYSRSGERVSAPEGVAFTVCQGRHNCFELTTYADRSDLYGHRLQVRYNPSFSQLDKEALAQLYPF